MEESLGLARLAARIPLPHPLTLHHSPAGRPHALTAPSAGGQRGIMMEVAPMVRLPSFFFALDLLLLWDVFCPLAVKCMAQRGTG